MLIVYYYSFAPVNGYRFAVTSGPAGAGQSPNVLSLSYGV
jgi:hypothetical protein